MRTSRLAIAAVLAASLLASCGKKEAAPTTTVAPATTTTTSTTTTSTTTTTTTIPIAPPPTDVVLTVPSTVPTPRKTGNGPCVDPDGTDYCIWGTQPVDLTVNNSRKATMNTGLRQVFTAVSKKMSTVEMVLESRTIGALVPATETTTADQLCVRVTLMSSMGLPIATTGLVTGSTKGVRQQITVPLESALVPGAEHKIQIEKAAACLGRDLSTYVAMSSNYKYPRKYGRMSIDGKSSDGSLWARID
jgi:hypothetical protein